LMIFSGESWCDIRILQYETESGCYEAMSFTCSSGNTLDSVTMARHGFVHLRRW
jgi:hypothetical protein